MNCGADFFDSDSALKAAARTVRSAATTVKHAVNYGVKELWTKTLQEGIQMGREKLAIEGIKRVAFEVALPLADYALSETILPVIFSQLNEGDFIETCLLIGTTFPKRTSVHFGQNSHKSYINYTHFSPNH